MVENFLTAVVMDPRFRGDDSGGAATTHAALTDEARGDIVEKR